MVICQGINNNRCVDVAGRIASVQLSPRGGDGFSTPVVHANQRQRQHEKKVLDDMRAQALASHTVANKPSEKPGTSLTDDLLNL